MPTRRTFVATWTFAAAGLALPGALRAEGETAEAFLKAIYAKIAAGKGDSGGQSFWLEPKDRQKWFSAALLARWADAEKRAKARGDELGPIDFDPFTNSQDPQVKGFSIEKLDAVPPVTKLRVTLKGPGYEGDGAALVFDLVAEKGWRIDDVQGSVGGDRWDLKELLAMP